MHRIPERDAGRVRRLARWGGSAAGAAGLLAFWLAGAGRGAASAPTGSYRASFHDSDNVLFGYTSNGSQPPATLGMQADTSPASARLSDGTFESAFHDNDNDLYLYKLNGAKINTPLGMDAGTSPALAGLPTGAGWITAFQASNNHLYIYTSAGSKIDTGLPMEPGTSPAIAIQPNGDWEVAFTGSNGRLTTYDAAGDRSRTADAMDTASSPSIAAMANGSYRVAFEASNDRLSIYHTGGTTNHTTFSMHPGTSPSIASQPNGDWQVAFQTRNNELGTTDSAANGLKIRDGMHAGTSPSVAPEPDGSYEIAFEASNDHLSIYHTGGTTNHTTFSMHPGTSPSAAITAPIPQATFTLGSGIVSIAESQVGYRDKPGSYCNPYTAYWGTGTPCGKGKSSEEWCADFAAWVWHRAGVSFTYGYDSGDINAGAVSFYQWGVTNGTWHAADSGYTPQPGDVAIYGLNTPAGTTAAHVAIVTGGTARGPNVINGDWLVSGSRRVATVTNQTIVTSTDSNSTDSLSGYVSPWRAPAPKKKRK